MQLYNFCYCNSAMNAKWHYVIFGDILSIQIKKICVKYYQPKKRFIKKTVKQITFDQPIPNNVIICNRYII